MNHFTVEVDVRIRRLNRHNERKTRGRIGLSEVLARVPPTADGIYRHIFDRAQLDGARIDKIGMYGTLVPIARAYVPQGRPDT